MTPIIKPPHFYYWQVLLSEIKTYGSEVTDPCKSIFLVFSLLHDRPCLTLEKAEGDNGD